MPLEAVISIILTLAFIGLCVLVFFKVSRRRKRKTSYTTNRLPQRLPHLISTNSQSLSTTPTYAATANTVKRSPAPIAVIVMNNDECLRFRMCPRCHSKNEKGCEMVITKKKANTYYCSICKIKFDIEGNIL